MLCCGTGRYGRLFLRKACCGRGRYGRLFLGKASYGKAGKVSCVKETYGAVGQEW